jgi:hypothetical protein
VGKEQGGLIHLLQQHKSLISSSPSSSHALSIQIKAPSANVWHYRLGHPSNPMLHLLYNLVLEISCDSKHICTICPLSRHRRLTFSQSSFVSTSPFDLIHCDICKFFFTKSINGSGFSLTIVDYYSIFTWVHLLQYKSQIKTILQSFFQLVQTQHNFKIKCLRSDHFAELKMDDFFLLLLFF